MTTVPATPAPLPTADADTLQPGWKVLLDRDHDTWVTIKAVTDLSPAGRVLVDYGPDWGKWYYGIAEQVPVRKPADSQTTPATVTQPTPQRDHEWATERRAIAAVAALLVLLAAVAVLTWYAP